MPNNTYKIVKYEESGVDVRFDLDNNTIWLTQSEIALIFNTAKDTIKKNIRRISLELNNISGGDYQSPTELDEEIVGYDGKTYKTKLYNLDMIEAISLRSKSTSGYEFVKWAREKLNDTNNTSLIKLFAL